MFCKKWGGAEKFRQVTGLERVFSSEEGY